MKCEMLLLLSLFLLLRSECVESLPQLSDLDHRNLVGPFDLDPAVDCAMRNLTWTYALTLQPDRAPLVAVFDALRLGIDCNATRPVQGVHLSPRTSKRRASSDFASVYYVDAVHGSDNNPGTLAAPFATVGQGVLTARAGSRPAQLLLRDAGVFHVNTTIALTPADSGLSIAAYAGENPVLSGGMPLAGLAWELVSSNTTEGTSTWRSPLLPGAFPPSFDTLLLGGRRAVRARYPNGNPETEIAPNGYTTANDWLPPWHAPSAVSQVNPLLLNASQPRRRACPPDACTPNGPEGIGPPWAIFCCFFWGKNGTVANMTTGSFWGTQPGPPGGGTSQWPGGLIAGNDTLPRLGKWTNVEGAFVHAFHGSGWGDWAYQLQSVDAATGAVAFSRGGFQEARGASKGGPLYFENLFEELDAPGEWFLSNDSYLFYVANGTEAPPTTPGVWVASRLDRILSIEGTQGAPVVDIEVVGLTLRDTRTTFMEPFSVGSGGDWSFHDGAALRLTGSIGALITDCAFDSVGGTGIAVIGFNRDASIDHNSFVWLGESAVIVAGMQPDRFNNTDGNFPAQTSITFNIASELGLYVKQTGFVYQAMSANTTILGNVMFNGPRAAINLNDGFAGGHVISSNVGFNFVRETDDHGVLNTWDRNTQAAHPDDPNNLDTRMILVDHNLFVCNYRAYYPIDNDDGSNSEVQRENFLLWGGAKSLMGYYKQFIGNTYVYVDYNPIVQPANRELWLLGSRQDMSQQERRLAPPPANGVSVCASSIAPYPFASVGLADSFRQNTCISSSSSNFFQWYDPCNDSEPTDGTMWLLSSNIYMSSDASYRNTCNGTTWNLTQAQAMGVDIGSVATGLPSLVELIEMGNNFIQTSTIAAQEQQRTT